jgi:hypothetical protein
MRSPSMGYLREGINWRTSAVRSSLTTQQLPRYGASLNGRPGSPTPPPTGEQMLREIELGAVMIGVIAFAFARGHALELRFTKMCSIRSRPRRTGEGPR